jgi:hypothetical protein
MRDVSRDASANSVYDVFEASNSSRFPRFDVTKRIEAIQEQGETIFVPSGWLHQVHNLVRPPPPTSLTPPPQEDTLSLNHNWLNGCNVDLFVEQLLADLVDVQRAIADCRFAPDYVALCEKVLKSQAGANFSTLYAMLDFIADRELAAARAATQEFKIMNKRLGEPEAARTVLAYFNITRLAYAVKRAMPETHVISLAGLEEGGVDFKVLFQKICAAQGKLGAWDAQNFW